MKTRKTKKTKNKTSAKAAPRAAAGTSARPTAAAKSKAAGGKGKRVEAKTRAAESKKGIAKITVAGAKAASAQTKSSKTKTRSSKAKSTSAGAGSTSARAKSTSDKAKSKAAQKKSGSQSAVKKKTAAVKSKARKPAEKKAAVANSSKKNTVLKKISAAKTTAKKPVEKKPAAKKPVGATMPALETIKELSDNYRWHEVLPPLVDEGRSISALRADLADVPVLTDDGRVTNVYHKLESENLMQRQDRMSVWRCLALVREAYLQLESSADEGGKGYQWNMNWKHTRAEVDQVYEAGKILGLTSDEIRDAILASIFSDSIKTRGNFIIHNVHGSQAAALALSYFWDTNSVEQMRSVQRIVLAIKQHQVAPPEFMARTVVALLARRLKLGSFDQVVRSSMSTNHDETRQRYILRSIYSKISHPFEEQNLTADLGRVNFNDEERDMLQLLDIDDWWVPHPKVPSSKIAHALITGDHSINYNNPDGFAKIALIRGPATEAVFEDATIYDSLESAMASFADSFNILLPEVRPLAIKGIRRTHVAVTRVMRMMTELFSGVVVGPRENAKNMKGSAMVAQAMERAMQKNPGLFDETAVYTSEAGRKYHDRSLERVGSLLEEWQTIYGPIPFSDRASNHSEPGPGLLPFWNSPLKYPRRDEHGHMDMSSLSSYEQKQFAFAQRIREIAVELLRAEQWFFS